MQKCDELKLQHHEISISTNSSCKKFKHKIKRIMSKSALNFDDDDDDDFNK
jgi:hypothetical protein